MASKTSTRKTTTRKSTSAKTAAAKSTTDTAPAEASPVPMPEPTVVTTQSTPVVTEADMKKPELVDMVVERTGLKKKDVKPAIEAALAILGETISRGRELNMQPLGKLRINRTQEKSNGRIIVCKLRQPKESGATPTEPLAEPAE